MRLDVILAMHAERRGRHSTKISMRKMPRNKKDHPFESFERVPFGGDSQKLKMLSTVTGDRALLYVV